MKFCERLKNYRTENNLTQKELADKLFVSRSAVAKWEQNRGMPSVDVLEKFAELSGCAVDELIGERQLVDIALETTEKTSKQKTFNLIMIITAVILLIATSFGFWGLLSRDTRVPILRSQTNEYYGWASVDGKKNDNEITIVKSEGRNMYGAIYTSGTKTFKLEEGVTKIYGKLGEEIALSDIRHDQKIKVTEQIEWGEYSQNERSDYYKEQVLRVDVIESHVFGDYYIHGVFVSPEEYTYPSAPATYFRYGEGRSEGYEYGGRKFDLKNKYPYLEWYEAGIKDSHLINVFESGSFQAGQGKEPSKNKAMVTIGKKIDELYIYVIDNSPKGYTFYDKVVNSGNGDRGEMASYVGIKGLAIKHDYEKYPSLAHAKEIELELWIYGYKEKEERLTIYEYDEYRNNIKKHEFECWEETTFLPLSRKYMLFTDSKTRFVAGYALDTDGAMLARGGVMDVSVANVFGFITKVNILIL